MTYDETLVIMSVLKASYPLYYKDMKKTEAEAVVSLWAEMFADDDFQVVSAAVKSFIVSDTKGFPPVIGVIKNEMRKLTNPEEMSEFEAWNLVNRAISRVCFYEKGSLKREFDKLPETIRRIVGRPQNLHEWGMLESDEALTVLASNFQRSYRAVSERQRKYDALPGDVRAFLDNVSESLFSLPGSQRAESDGKVITFPGNRGANG